MMDPMELVMMGVMMMAGSKGDLLDMMTVDQYWQAKQVVVTVAQLKADAGPDAAVGDLTAVVADLSSDDFKVRNAARKKLEAVGPAAAPALQAAAHARDPELALTANALLDEFAKGSHAREIRRLMAIRTLGEHKEASAADMLHGLESSTQPFVATYARRAEAAINGTPLPVADMHKTLAGDLVMLPADTGLVVQGVRSGWDTLSVDKMVQGRLAELAATQPAPADGGDASQEVGDPKWLTVNTTRGLLHVAEEIGDVRADAITFAITRNVDDATGCAVTVLHGEYDPASVLAALESEKDMDTKVDKIDGIDAVAVQDEALLLFPSADELIVVYDDDAADRAKRAADVVKGLKAGKPMDGQLDPAGEIGKLLAGSDGGHANSVAWGAMAGIDALKADPTFSGIATVTMDARRDGKNIAVTLAATGVDAEKLKGSKETIDAGITALMAQLGNMPGQMPAAEMLQIQPLVDMLKSVKTTQDGNAGTMTGAISPGIVQALLSEIGDFNFSEIDDSGDAANGPGTQP